MSFNVAMLEAMQAEGLSLEQCIRILKAAGPDSTADRRREWDRNRKRQQAEAKRKSGGNSTGNPPEKGSNEIDILTSQNSQKTETKVSKKAHREKLQAIGSCLRQAFPPPLDVPAAVWADFLSSPGRKKAGMSDTAYAGIVRNLTELAEHGFPPGEMIALAVERGWRTVTLKWVQNEQRKQSYERPSKSPLQEGFNRAFGTG